MFWISQLQTIAWYQDIQNHQEQQEWKRTNNFYPIYFQGKTEKKHLDKWCGFSGKPLLLPAQGTGTNSYKKMMAEYFC